MSKCSCGKNLWNPVKFKIAWLIFTQNFLSGSIKIFSIHQGRNPLKTNSHEDDQYWLNRSLSPNWRHFLNDVAATEAGIWLNKKKSYQSFIPDFLDQLAFLCWCSGMFSWQYLEDFDIYHGHRFCGHEVLRQVDSHCCPGLSGEPAQYISFKSLVQSHHLIKICPKLL